MAALNSTETDCVGVDPECMCVCVSCQHAFEGNKMHIEMHICPYGNIIISSRSTRETQAVANFVVIERVKSDENE